MCRLIQTISFFLLLSFMSSEAKFNYFTFLNVEVSAQKPRRSITLLEQAEMYFYSTSSY